METNPTPPTAVVLITEARAAERLGCSRRLLQKWRTTGEGPAYVQVGRLVRYREADLEAFIAAQTVRHTHGRGR